MTASVKQFVNFSPFPCLVLDDCLSLVCASDVVYNIFSVTRRRLGNEEDQELQALEAAVNKEEALVSAIGIASMKLNNPGSQTELEWRYYDKVYNLQLFSFGLEGELFFAIYFNDVTAVYEQHKSHEMARQFLEEIINAMPVGITVLNERQEVTVLNLQQIEMCKRIGHDLTLFNSIGSPMHKLFPPSSDVDWHEVESELKRSDSVKRELSAEYMVNGEKVIIEYRIVSFQQEGSDARGTTIIADDVTMKRELENELKQAEFKNTQIQTLQEINIALKHEIFNVLTPISMNAELLKYSLNEDQEDEKEMVESVLEQVNRLQSFIDRLSNVNEIKTTSYISDTDEQMLDLG